MNRCELLLEKRPTYQFLRVRNMREKVENFVVIHAVGFAQLLGKLVHPVQHQ